MNEPTPYRGCAEHEGKPDRNCTQCHELWFARLGTVKHRPACATQSWKWGAGALCDCGADHVSERVDG